MVRLAVYAVSVFQLVQSIDISPAKPAVMIASDPIDRPFLRDTLHKLTEKPSATPGVIIIAGQCDCVWCKLRDVRFNGV
jgi:hypothetical protein